MFKKKEKVNAPQKLTNGNLFAYGTLLLMMNTTNAANIYFYRIALGSTDIIALSGLVSLVFSASLCCRCIRCMARSTPRCARS